MVNKNNSKERCMKTIGIVAPSFFIEKKHNFEVGLKYLINCGYILKFGDTVYKKEYNTTGSAIARAIDINRMFADSSVDIIIATDGGCRAIEVLEFLDYNLIKNNPKPICGFSDITHILLAIYSKTGNSAIHGIDLINGFGQEDSMVKNKNMDLFWNLVEKDIQTIDFSKAEVLKRGIGEGKIIGGWLNAIQNLAGTDYFPKNKRFILFWEAIDEEPNKINIMLQSLKLRGLFDNLEAMIVGQLTNCIEKEYFDCVPSIEDIILDACEGYNFPIIINAPFGHGEEKTSFKIGTNIKINTEEII